MVFDDIWVVKVFAVIVLSFKELEHVGVNISLGEIENLEGNLGSILITCKLGCGRETTSKSS